MQNSCLGSVRSGSCSTQNWHCDSGAQCGGGVMGEREGGVEGLCVQLAYYQVTWVLFCVC